MIENFWHDKYPEGIAAEIDPSEYANAQAVLHQAVTLHGGKPAFTNFGHTLTWGDIYRLSGQLAAYFQNHTDLKPGDRIAIQLPNTLQYPVALFGAMRAGLVIVNTNPLYTAREMAHQFVDSGAKALICLANFAHMVEEVLPETQIRHLLITEVGDLLPPLKRFVINTAVRHIKKMVPKYHLPLAVPYNRALSLGKGQPLKEANPKLDDIAVLQYTGGTTGVAKGAMLTHRNLIANMLQASAMLNGQLTDADTVVAPLPLYHIYAFTVHCMVIMRVGAHNLLITNPRDGATMLRDLARTPFTGFIGLNTLFIGLCNSEKFRNLDFSKLRLTISGGMALQTSVAKRWQEVTGKLIAEGYGLTEASPLISLNPLQQIELGTIGIPVPSTEIKIVDEDGNEAPVGSPGELCARGPQVMKGYWNQEQETANVLDPDGWLHTGDIAVVQENGYIRLVDRKKDMILVSGFNVYPNELEEVLSQMPGVVKCAAVGIPSEKTGEAIKLFVVAEPGSDLTEKKVLNYMHDRVTGYKRPKFVEFRDSLPESNVGKVLRRELRAEELKRAEQAKAK